MDRIWLDAPLPSLRVRTTGSVADVELNEAARRWALAHGLGLRALQDLARAGLARGPACVPALVGSLSSAQDSIRASAAFALGKIGPAARAAVPALRENLRRPDPIVRLASIRALLQIQPGEQRLAAVAAPMLLEALGSEYELVRAEAVTALGERSDFGKRAIPQLKKLLQDPSPLVRDRAAEALKRLGE